MKRQKEIDERIENAKMRVIKWEKIWNDYRKWKNGERERERERERESNRWYLLWLQAE